MTTGQESTNGAITSIKYYSLTDANVRKFYLEWRFKTMAIIRKKGWSKPFDEPTEAIPTRDQVTATTATDEMKSMYQANIDAYDQIVMGCSGIPLGLVMRADGNARLAIKNLDEKYASQDESKLTGLIQEFTRCKLENTETDPYEWILKLDQINAKLKSIGDQYEKKDYEMKAHLLSNLPDGYSDVRTKISGKEGDYTVAQIEKEIADKWNRDFEKADDQDNSNGKNIALAVDGKKATYGKKSWKKFKGKCRKCGKIGHKAADCRSNKNGVCFECGEDGHFARDCPKKKKPEDTTVQSGMFVGTLFCQTAASISTDSTQEESFLMDTGASCHVVGNEKYLVNLRSSNEKIVIGDNSEMAAVKEGTLCLETKDGVQLRLNNVKVVPGIAKNIIGVNLLLNSGSRVEMGGGTLLLRNPTGTKILIEKRDDPLFYLKAKRVKPKVSFTIASREDESDEAAGWVKVEGKKRRIDINEAHELYGHVSEGPLRDILAKRNYVVTGSRTACEACAFAKAKAKGVSKVTKELAKEKGERLYIDLSGPYKNTVSKNKYWILIVDDKTRKAWSFFVPNKGDMKKVTSSLINILKGAKVVVKYIRCDNGGENVSGLKDVCNDYGITLEMTAPHTPQTNGVVERKFVTIRDRAQAMMLAARLNDEHQGKLWAEAVSTATKLHNAVPNQGNGGDSPDMLWYGEHPKILNHLVQWGRIGYVANRGPKKKLDPKSTKMVFMGYADGHAGDVFRMFNPATSRIIATRDVVWAEWHGSQDIPASLKMFANDMEVNTRDDQIGEDTVNLSPQTVDDDDDYPHSGAGRKIAGAQNGNSNVDGNATQRTRSTRVARELAKLNTYYNPIAVPVLEEDSDSDASTGSEVFNVQLSSDPGEPNGYSEAMKSPDRLKWIDAMKKEIENFLTRKVWTPTKLEDLKPGQKPIRVKWVMKKKTEQDGSTRYKGRIVVRGFVQIPGVDFNLTHSPVAQDSSIKMTLALALAKDKWSVEMIDIEAAFLEADLDEDIYIEWPQGVEEFGYVTKDEMKGKCLKLEKAMYGCVQSPLMFFKTYSKHLKDIGLTQSLADPCMWFKSDKSGNLTLIVAVYVDDCIIAGLKPEIETFKADVQKRFKITDLGPIKKHLGVWYTKCADDRGEFYKLTMEKYQHDTVEEYEKATGKKVKAAKTPGFPGQTLMKNDGEEVDKDNYRKILGRLMWFTRKLMPECGNVIRELATYMDNPGHEHWKAMGRLIGYIGKERTVELHLMKTKGSKGLRLCRQQLRHQH